MNKKTISEEINIGAFFTVYNSGVMAHVDHMLGNESILNPSSVNKKVRELVAEHLPEIKCIISKIEAAEMRSTGPAAGRSEDDQQNTQATEKENRFVARQEIIGSS